MKAVEDEPEVMEEYDPEFMRDQPDLEIPQFPFDVLAEDDMEY